ncbi:hypothetical protein ACF0C8_26320 [Pseudomonas aeruginosa]|jgi:hypothetical protein|uniref:hypothetical protein n=1 Tax=Pseudomonas aeruginosa TaxID=287 RepID=UPI0005B5398C|nr:hypothetical protein [Pseudomonas aeruginosa]AUA70989.1 hypothetical protein CWI25_13535 [Pseudomonas aeruginosa]AUA95551.1 hypothetical protein CWI24_13720 [Pseudomonas aeruginosa]EKV6876606.1 hypothetical protein [Pseudomonas aeruginosa]ELG5278736.1 hypothetical protein [Pseudomonas aeruginosa]ELQ7375838.1 hypothetical protein [Pseudomonas aeruginosa]
MKKLIGLVLLAALAGCSNSDDAKMISACESFIRKMAVDPAGISVNSSSVITAAPEERNLRRFAELKSRNGQLSVDQEAALQVDIRRRAKLQESYVSVDYTDHQSLGTSRDKAVCWYMNTGRGFELASVSALGRSISGFPLFAFFVEHGAPEHLSSSGIIE